MSRLSFSWRLSIVALDGMLMNRIDPDIVNLKTEVSALAFGSRWQACLQMQKPVLPAKLGRPSRHELGVINAALSAKLGWPFALAVFHGLRRAFVRPDEVTVNTVINVCEDDAWTSALLLLTEKHDLVGFNSAMGCIHRCSVWPAALLLASSCETRRLIPDAYTVGEAVQACAERWQLALSLLDWRSSCKSQIAVNAAAAACARARQWQAALQFLNSMQLWRRLGSNPGTA